MILKNIIKNINLIETTGNIEIEISDICYNSSKVTKGSLFVCLCGSNFDGHDYIDEAVKNGARAIAVQKNVNTHNKVAVIKVKNTREFLAYASAAFFENPAKELITIGITGTKGKTTTSFMIRSILEQPGLKTGVIGTIGAVVGNEIVKLSNTTPESYEIQKNFRKMVNNGCKCVVLEASSIGLKNHRLDGFKFDYGIFTNLEPDHIGPNEHKDLADYIHCKSLLFKQCKHGIFNADAHHLDEVLEGHTCEVETYGFGEDADLRASNVHLMDKGGTLGVAYHMSGALDMDVEIDIPGTFSVYNSMTAIAICRHFGVQKETILNSLSQIRVKGRVEILPVSSKFTLMIDYAHNAMSLESLLSTLREYHPKRLVCLFGCGGNRSRERRFEMGEVSSKMADLTIVTSDNPRNEQPEAIIADIVTGVEKADGKYITIIDRAEAIRYAIEHAQEGDVIVLAGKGHEDYQEICGKKYHMDERELVADVVKDGNFLQ